MNLYEIRFSKHALQRAASRGISRQMILDAISYGRCLYRQGLRFFIISGKDMPRHFVPHYASRLMHTVVILSEDQVVVTTYKSRDAFSHVKRKPKRLL